MNVVVPPEFNNRYHNIYKNMSEGNITTLKAFRSLKQEESRIIQYPKEITPTANFPSLKEVLLEFQNLVGLEQIQEIVKEMYACVIVNRYRKDYFLKCEDMVLHMVFKGNPGTGKTTVARILGKIFAKLNIISQGQLIEVERADLVGEYIGHTANKTREQIKRALGGILFIDEAYSLGRGGEKDFGKEAIDTLVKAMEDHKNQFIVILAGYRYEMESFMRLNPGLSSRFPIQIDYPDYDFPELMQIAKLMYLERDYYMSDSAEAYLKTIIEKEKLKSVRNFGNARFIRNLIEKSIRRHAIRLLNSQEYTKKNIMQIEATDLL